MAYPVRFYRVSPSCKKRGQNLTPSYFTGSPRPRLILECPFFMVDKETSKVVKLVLDYLWVGKLQPGSRLLEK